MINIIKQPIKYIRYKIKTNKLFIPSLVSRYSKHLIQLDENTNDQKMRILVLNPNRFPTADLEVLRTHPKLQFILLPVETHRQINSAFSSFIQQECQNEIFLIFDPQHNPKVERVKKEWIDFLSEFLIEFKRKNRINAIITCSFYYKQDYIWSLACNRINLPFFAIHKENMKDESTYDLYIKRYRERRYNFSGAKIFVFNQNEKDIICKAKVCDQSKVEITGSLRMDSLYHKVHKQQLACPTKQAVLFSFRHSIGGLVLKNNNGGFSDSRSEGFVQFFEQVHGAFAELAKENPDYTFIIKPKWLENWEGKIEEAVKRESNLNIDEIHNLKITIDKPAQVLMESSKIVTGFNSTTLLESKLIRRPTIIPHFAEANGKYQNHVYFQKFFNEFIIADSKQDFKNKIKKYLENEYQDQPSMSEEMIRHYIGFFDGNVLERIFKAFNNEINMERDKQ